MSANLGDPPDAPSAVVSHNDEVASAMSGLFGRDTLYTALWAIQLLGAALVTPFITRLMGAGEFGGAVAANAVMQVLFVFGGFGLQTAIQRQHSRPDGGPIDARRLLTLSIIGAAALTTLAETTQSLWASGLGFTGNTLALQYAIAWAGTAAVTSSSLALLRSEDRLLAFSLSSLLQSVAAELTSIMLVKIVAPTASSFILGQLIAQVAALALSLVFCRPAALSDRHRQLVRDSLKFALPLVPAALSTFILASADRLIIQGELGAAQTARYQIAYNIGAMPLLLLNVLNGAWMPRFFAVTDEANRTALLAAARRALDRLLIPVVVGLSLGAPVLLRLWAPGSYRPGQLHLVTALVIISAVPGTAAMSATRGLLTVDRTGTIAIATMAAAVGNIALNLVLVPVWGLSGSALATFLAYGLQHAILHLHDPSAGHRTAADNRLLIGILAAIALALVVTYLPDNAVVLATRFTLAVIVAGWFAIVLLKLNRGSPTADGA